MMKVCHITSVHGPEDVRIFRKECVSLARVGYDVTPVQQGDSYDKDGVHILGFGDIASNRLQRMLFTARKAYRKALEANADIYHLHDPELLPYGLRLKKKGKKVIFDSHEDVPNDILSKYWIPTPLRKMISRVYAYYEIFCFSRLDGVIGVTPSLCSRLERSGHHSAMITNYPILEEDLPQPALQNRKIVFAGLISELWNIHILLRAVGSIENVTLELRSKNILKSYETVLRGLPGWEKVNFPGGVSPAEVLRLFSECSCGVALAKKIPNTGGDMGTLGNTKLFEYMMAGLPVVCTDFVLWQEIVNRWHCGICVDPENVEEISSALSYLLDHPEEARRMGENGRQAVKTEFNWGAEEKKLLTLYREIAEEG